MQHVHVKSHLCSGSQPTAVHVYMYIYVLEKLMHYLSAFPGKKT
jgi:hypothetical protein